MNTGIAIAVVGLALGLGAGGTYMWEHRLTPKSEERALPKGSLVFGPTPIIVTPVPQVPLTRDVLAAKARELAPPSSEPPAVEAPVEQAQPVKVVVHKKQVRHKARRKRYSRPAAKLKSKWVQPQPQQQPGFSLERLFNVR